jgi:hypothetical protein
MKILLIFSMILTIVVGLLLYDIGYDKAYENRISIINRRSYIKGFTDGVYWNHKTGNIDYWHGYNYFKIHIESNYISWTNTLFNEWGIK